MQCNAMNGVEERSVLSVVQSVVQSGFQSSESKVLGGLQFPNLAIYISVSNT
jgi:hypothetical protein